MKSGISTLNRLLRHAIQEIGSPAHPQSSPENNTCTGEIFVQNQAKELKTNRQGLHSAPRITFPELTMIGWLADYYHCHYLFRKQCHAMRLPSTAFRSPKEKATLRLHFIKCLTMLEAHEAATGISSVLSPLRLPLPKKIRSR